MPTIAPIKTVDDLRKTLRPGQRELADWDGGPLAVSAVPGAGKSTGMAVAATIAIARHQLHARRQLIVVTFTRSAAANIKAKIKQNLKDLGVPQQGFQVYTLHGLGWAIARTHLELTELNNESVLVTPTQNNRLIRTCVEQWIATNPQLYQRLLEGRQFDGEETERLRRQSVLRTEVLPELASTTIREAKSSGLFPADLRRLADEMTDDYSVLAIAAGLYELYQEQLRRRNWMDYDEMILAALRVLDDLTVRHYWQTQVFAVFEDEAQDSSPLQTRLLEILAADPDDPSNLAKQNLVRVGDPNQAINSTFTPADPIFFREFCDRCRKQRRLATMTQAGRSTRTVMEAANFVLQWANAAKLTGNEEPFRHQLIQPVGAKDPQPNPPVEGQGLELYTPDDTYQTVELIGQRAIALFKKYPEATAAVLVRENRQGQFVARELYRWYGEALNLYEVGGLERQSHVPAEMLTLLQFCDRPHSPDYLKSALSTLVERKLIPAQDLNALTSFPEQFLYPGPLDPPQDEPVQQARRFCISLLQARLELPAYQLIPFFAYTLRYEQNELATADKLSDRISQQMQGENTLSAMISVLNDIVGSERFEPVNADDNDQRYTQPGQLTIITMHKAKGLDWDYVFLPFLHDSFIPGRFRIPPQGQFLGDFTLSEIARAQIRAYLHQQPTFLDTPAAWERAQNLKTAEEFRLLYVAMTRAKRLLWMSAASQAPFTWNKPENVDDRKPSPVFLVLQEQFPSSVIP
ncbi:MAG: ATP-dependent helicase [Oscillatoriales cyanobacterium C42_A2020_001]|nr:ATP-dependent helicase [Leptolyngbyaceae cyanobacterium C42_A2020_001]